MIPTIAACLFILLVVIAAIFHKKTKKMWDRYSAHKYRHVDGEYHDGLPDDLPTIDEISHYPSDNGSVEMTSSKSGEV
jgi:hypothetical protein